MLRGTQGFYVYVVNPDKTVGTRVIKPGPVDANWMAIEGDVKPGELVVIDGTDRLRDGAKVEVIAADPKLRAGAGASKPTQTHGAAHRAEAPAAATR